jgi:hypothetical protein
MWSVLVVSCVMHHPWSWLVRRLHPWKWWLVALSTALNELFKCPRVGVHILQDIVELLQVMVGFEI